MHEAIIQKFENIVFNILEAADIHGMLIEVNARAVRLNDTTVKPLKCFKLVYSNRRFGSSLLTSIREALDDPSYAIQAIIPERRIKSTNHDAYIFLLECDSQERVISYLDTLTKQDLAAHLRVGDDIWVVMQKIEKAFNDAYREKYNTDECLFDGLSCKEFQNYLEKRFDSKFQNQTKSVLTKF